MRFKCPKCSVQMQAEADAAGKTVKCPSCSAKIKIPEDPNAPKPDAPAAPPEPEAPTPSSKLNIPQPTGALAPTPSPSSQVGPVGVSSKSAAADPPAPDAAKNEAAAESHDEHHDHDHDHGHAGPRPIEYFYGGKVGNLAQINFWAALAIGVGITIGWFAIMHLIHGSVKGEDGEPGNFLTRLFLERSWVQYATTLLAGWTIGILILKLLHINRQRRSLLIELVPQDISPEVNIHNVADFYDHVIHMPRRTHNSFMFHRIRKGLEYFYVRESNQEVATMMSSQSDIDANAISGSYSLSKVFLWAIPIMGFIGTVLGIGAAIGEFAKTLSAASEEPAAIVQNEGGDTAAADGADGAGTDGEATPAEGADGAPADGDAAEAGNPQDAMMAGLKDVLGGLGTAFDTTFLALIFSILLMIPASSLQAAEEDVLNQVDEYCNDNLIKRLNDGSAGANFTDAGALKSLGEAIAESNKHVVSQFGEIHGNMKSVYDQQTEHYGKVAAAVEKQLGSIDTRAKEYEKRLDEDFFENLEKIREDSVKTISSTVGPLAEGIAELNKVLKELDGKQVKIEKKKRWLFG